MWTELACQALRERCVLELHYNGFSRAVEVHAVGYSRIGDAVVRAWQVRGGSARGEKTGWKLMKLVEATGATVTREASQAPRPGYRPGDAAMTRIIGEI